MQNGSMNSLKNNKKVKFVQSIVICEMVYIF